MLQKNQGFSLVELMVATAIVGILASIAIPRYNSYVVRTERTTHGQGELLNFANALERFATVNGTYAGAADGGAATGAPANTVYSQFAPSSATNAGDALYALSIVAADATDFVIAATPTSGSKLADDVTLAMTSANQRFTCDGRCTTVPTDAAALNTSSSWSTGWPDGT